MLQKSSSVCTIFFRGYNKSQQRKNNGTPSQGKKNVKTQGKKKKNHATPSKTF